MERTRATKNIYFFSTEQKKHKYFAIIFHTAIIFLLYIGRSPLGTSQEQTKDELREAFQGSQVIKIAQYSLTRYDIHPKFNYQSLWFP